MTATPVNDLSSSGVPGGKAGLRARALAARAALPEQVRNAASRAIASRLLALPEYRSARVVAAYSGFGDEIDTAPFLAGVLAAGKTLVLPRIVRARTELEMYAVADLVADRKPGPWGILEPDPARCRPVPPGALEFVLVPGVAFDRRGGRVGYGKGYYDRLLQAARRDRPEVFAVAAAFEAQMCDRVPVEAHDQSIGAVVTETNNYWITGAAPLGE